MAETQSQHTTPPQHTTQLVGDFILDRLQAWGVHRIYGYPGDGINGVIGALRRAGDRFDFIQVAHEQLAGFMATAHAKFSGEVGVCLATSGPSAINMLTGLYDAKMDHQPVVAIVGQQSLHSLGASAQQETDLKAILQDVAGAYVEQVSVAEQVRHVIDRAFRIAIAERTVTAVIIPNDIQREAAVEQPPHEKGQQHSSFGFSSPHLVPEPDDIRSAADVLNAGKRIAILVGAGALNATDEVIEVANRLNAGVAKALLGKSVVSDDLPFVTGSAGWLGTSASNRMLQECDTLFMIGTSFPYTQFLPRENEARGVQIDIAPRRLNIRYPMEVALNGDCRETLKLLLAHLVEREETAEWRTEVEAWAEESWATAREQAQLPADPTNPQKLVWELSERLPDNAVITGDSGSGTVWLARFIRLRQGMKFSLSGNLSTMGSAVPYATAAKLMYPDRVAVAVVGDGAMQMCGLNALIDVAKYWKRWEDPRLIVLVLNNRDLNYVSWEQRVMEGEPKYSKSQDLPDIRYADYAKMIGLDGVRVDSPDQIGPAWDQAFKASRPFVIDAVVSAAVPTLPPQLEPEQEKKIQQALEQGDPDAEDVKKMLRAYYIQP